MNHLLTVETYKITVFGNESSHHTLVLGIEDHHEGEELWQECQLIGAKNLTLATISDVDWNNDLTPWKAPSLFKKAPDFEGRADDFIAKVSDKILPAILASLEFKPKNIVFAGYSLAGLFALYLAYQTNIFDGIVSASGSLWYPDFLAYVEQHPLSAQTKLAYFSVGDKEAKTRNVVMQTVEENTRKIAELLAESGIKTTFELNQGGHFVDDTKRVAKGIHWILENLK